MSFCEHCGAKIVHGSSYCDKCGKETEFKREIEEKDIEQRKQQRMTFIKRFFSLKILLLIAIMVLLALVLFLPIRTVYWMETEYYTIQEPYEVTESYTVDVPYTYYYNYDIATPSSEINGILDMYIHCGTTISNYEPRGGNFVITFTFYFGGQSNTKRTTVWVAGNSNQYVTEDEYAYSLGDDSSCSVSATPPSETRTRQETKYRTITKYRDVTKEKQVQKMNKVNLWFGYTQWWGKNVDRFLVKEHSE